MQKCRSVNRLNMNPIRNSSKTSLGTRSTERKKEFLTPRTTLQGKSGGGLSSPWSQKPREDGLRRARNRYAPPGNKKKNPVYVNLDTHDSEKEDELGEAPADEKWDCVETPRQNTDIKTISQINESASKDKSRTAELPRRRTARERAQNTAEIADRREPTIPASKASGQLPDPVQA